MSSKIHGFKLLKSEKIPEIAYVGAKSAGAKAIAYEYLHTSGAKLLYLENDDPEMAFTIGFKTLPKDSTGVFHILEHSVLCGSKKFPVKEPFTNLLKSSMQTFLNAMTFPDKTIYPVASTNEKDFYNLINVYMDAVLFPNIYKNKNIFYQEGGHKTLDGFSGVVFNEMSGVYSDPQEHIFEGLMQQLFPGSCYSYSSGGAPEEIKTLTYEEYLAQHNTNYSLQNAYIIVYGKLDINKMLSYLNDEYLSKTDELKKWRGSASTIAQGKWENDYKFNGEVKPKITEVQTAKENAECGAGFVIKRDHRYLAATRVLLNAIASSNESPLKKALLDENFCADVDVDIVAELYEPFIIVECKGSKEGASKNLNALIANKVKEITSKGISKELLEASISNIEFKLKEKLPDCTNGLDYSICVLSEWLYDDAASTSALNYIDDLKWLKEHVNTDYFDNLANEIFIENKHIALVEVKPIDKKPPEKPNYTEEEEIKITELCDGLTKWQETPNSKEDEAKIPVMDKNDISDIIEYDEPIITTCEPNPIILSHLVLDPGITHLNRYYSLSCINLDELPYASVLSLLLGKLDTKKHSSEQINTLIQSKLGHFEISLSFLGQDKDINYVNSNFCVKTSSLEENAKYTIELVEEILFETDFSDCEKIKKILLQKKVELEQAFVMAGHAAAINTALAGILPAYHFVNLSSGVEFYKFLKNLINNFDKEKPNIANYLKDISNRIFRNFMTYSCSNLPEECEVDSEIDQKMITNNIKNLDSWNVHIKNSNKLAYKIPSDVNYCAEVFDTRLSNEKITGQDITSSKIIALDYLWNEVRVKSGAYGAGMLLNNRGTCKLYSYRDPQNKNTYKLFENCGKWLENKDLSQRELDNFVISSVAKIDAPLTTRQIINYLDYCYLSNIPFKQRYHTRNEIIATSLKDVRNSGKKITEQIKHSNKCIFGGKNIEDLKSEGFKIIDLFSV